MPRTKITNLLCIDDEPDIEATCNALSDKTFKIDVRYPHANWSKQIFEMRELLSNGGYKGVLIDFRLDELHSGKKTRDNNNETVSYTAEALVSELRRRSVERGSDESYPIVLWSTAQNLQEFYHLNPAYSRAYDLIWDKNAVSGSIHVHAAVLKSLVCGYSLIHKLSPKDRCLATLLNCPEPSLLADLELYLKPRPTAAPYAFQYTLFIIHDVLSVAGPLIDKDTLFAFLGCDPLSHRTMLKVLSCLGSEISYRGLFSDVYERFWRATIIQRLEEFTGANHWLSLSAAERIDVLKAKLRGLEICPASPIDKTYSTDYDSICVVTRKPLAKRNGFRVFNDRLLPWTEAWYVAGASYRRGYAQLKKTLPLDAEDKDRFAIQFGIKP